MGPPKHRKIEDAGAGLRSTVLCLVVGWRRATWGAHDAICLSGRVVPVSSLFVLRGRIVQRADLGTFIKSTFLGARSHLEIRDIVVFASRLMCPAKQLEQNNG